MIYVYPLLYLPRFRPAGVFKVKRQAALKSRHVFRTYIVCILEDNGGHSISRSAAIIKSLINACQFPVKCTKNVYNH